MAEPTTTKKYRDFVDEDMNNKSILMLPGIGVALGNKLVAKGYPMAKDVYAELKKINLNKAKFQEWLKATCGATLKQSSDCYETLKKWHDQFGKTNDNSVICEECEAAE